MKRKNIGRVAGVAAASLALGAMAQSALAARRPACGPGNNAQTFSSNESKPIPDDNATGASTDINVSGKTGSSLRDVDVKTSRSGSRATNIRHLDPPRAHETASGTQDRAARQVVDGQPGGANGYNGIRLGRLRPEDGLRGQRSPRQRPGRAAQWRRSSPEGSLGGLHRRRPERRLDAHASRTPSPGDAGTLERLVRLDLATVGRPRPPPATSFNGGGAQRARPHPVGPATLDEDADRVRREDVPDRPQPRHQHRAPPRPRRAHDLARLARRAPR